MNFIKISPLGDILGVTELESGEGVKQITDEQSVKLHEIMESGGSPVWFEDDVTSYSEQSDEIYRLVWDQESGSLVRRSRMTPQQQAHKAASDVFDSLPPGKQALWEQVRVKVSKLLKEGDFEGAKETIETVPNLYTGMAADRKAFLALFP